MKFSQKVVVVLLSVLLGGAFSPLVNAKAEEQFYNDAKNSVQEIDDFLVEKDLEENFQSYLDETKDILSDIDLSAYKEIPKTSEEVVTANFDESLLSNDSKNFLETIEKEVLKKSNVEATPENVKELRLLLSNITSDTLNITPFSSKHYFNIRTSIVTGALQVIEFAIMLWLTGGSLASLASAAKSKITKFVTSFISAMKSNNTVKYLLRALGVLSVGKIVTIIQNLLDPAVFLANYWDAHDANKKKDGKITFYLIY